MGIIVYLAGLMVLWAVVSVPVYFAGKVIKGDQVGFGDAMTATLAGVVVYYIVYYVVAFALVAVIGSPAGVLALVLGLLAWLAAFKASFRTSWTGALGIVVLAWAILVALDVVLVTIFGVRFPDFYPF